MKVIGLTGGIATGKSTVRALFEEYNVPCIDLDIIAREVVEPKTSAHGKIVRLFGTEILEDPDDVNSPLNRPKLGKIVFGDEEKRKQLNKATHTAIRKRVIELLIVYFIKGEPVVIIDVPLLYETKMDAICSKVVVVYLPRELQLERLHKRNPDLGEEAEQRINSQMTCEEKRNRTSPDLVIDNSGSLENTKKQVAKIYQSQFPHSHIFTIRNYLIITIIGITGCATYLFWNAFQ